MIGISTNLDTLISQLTDLARAAPVTAEPFICTDMIDIDNFGKQMGTDYTVGEGETAITAHIPNKRTYPHIEIAVGEISIPLDHFEQSIPQVLALLADPQFQVARSTWQRGS